MRAYFRLALLCFGLMASVVQAQSEQPWEERTNTLAEDVLQYSELPTANLDLYENVLPAANQLLNLNTVSAAELNSLWILTPSEIDAILSHREKYGSFLSIFELAAIRRLASNSLLKLLPFVEVLPLASALPTLKEIGRQHNHFLIARSTIPFQRGVGYSVRKGNDGSHLSKYAGNPYAGLLRYRYQLPGKLSWGFTAEKDAGEPTYWKPSQHYYVVDFLSAHMMVEHQWGFKKIVLGDYQLGYGQGLVFAGGFALGKTAETVLGIQRYQLGVRPFTSAQEGKQMRGVAAVRQIGDVELTAFLSAKKIDVSQTLSIDSTFATPFQTYTYGSIRGSGLHRTANEIAARQNVTESMAGLALQYQNKIKTFTAGVVWAGTRYSRMIGRPSAEYAQFQFQGQNFINASGFYSYFFKNASVFGELATTDGRAFAACQGLLVSLTRQLDASLHVRSYSPAFYAPYSNGLAQASGNQNERGLYLGLQYKPTYYLKINAFIDRFSFPWLRYQVSAPSAGFEYLVRATTQPTKAILAFIQLKHLVAERDVLVANAKTNILQPAKRTQWVLHTTLKLSPTVVVQARVQASRYQLGQGQGRPNKQSNGSLLAVDIAYKLRMLKLTARYAIFDADTYDDRQYAHEQNVLYAYSFPAYFGRGTRLYVILNAKASKRLEFWLRYARTRYTGQASFGSGLDRVQGTLDSELTLQTRIWLGGV